MRLWFYPLVLLSIFSTCPAYASSPSILVSIKPIHALVSGVTQGVTEPELLVQKNVSPHTYALKPSDAKKIQEADIVFFVSRDLEIFLTRAIKSNYKAKATVVELQRVPGITLLPVHEQPLWQEAHNGEGGEDEARHHLHGRYDPHIWLNPMNAIVIVNNVRDVLIRKDPEHTVQYTANAKKMVEDLTALDAELTAKLAPYSDVAYLVFHDAYQYFEKHYHLNTLGAITLNPEKAPGAKTLQKLEETISRNNVVCLFTEPQYSSSVISILAASTGVGVGVLDAEWGTDEQGRETYFILMRGLSKNLLECFDKKRSLMS